MPTIHLDDRSISCCVLSNIGRQLIEFINESSLHGGGNLGKTHQLFLRQFAVAELSHQVFTFENERRKDNLSFARHQSGERVTHCLVVDEILAKFVDGWLQMTHFISSQNSCPEVEHVARRFLIYQVGDKMTIVWVKFYGIGTESSLEGLLLSNLLVFLLRFYH